MNMDKEWMLIQFSFVLPVFATIASFLMSIIEIIYHFHNWLLVAGSIVTMGVSGLGFYYFLLVLGTADGLNVPHAIPERTKRFLLIGGINLTLFVAEIILF